MSDTTIATLRAMLANLDDAKKYQSLRDVMKNLLFKATELGVNIEFEPIGDEEYEKCVDRQG